MNRTLTPYPVNIKHMTLILICLLLWTVVPACAAQDSTRVVIGAERPDQYLPLLKGKRVALFANHTSLAGGQHLLDVLTAQGVNVVAIFAPEHGFRGTADAGESVSSQTDAKTGTPILSLYDGRNKQPSDASMKLFDVLVADIQDIGLRFYTYHLTLWRLMDACARHGREVVVLDRPNPNGSYVDGPVLDMRWASGVGRLPIPVVHGMTLGELAQMMNGEGWLPGGKACRLHVVTCQNYTHHTRVKLDVPPSPNLRNMKAIYLYPSTCLMEGTVMSVGRGTDNPFVVYGHPDMKSGTYVFTPKPDAGAKHPKWEGKTCRGFNLDSLPDDDILRKGLNLDYVIRAYHDLNLGARFFTSYFDLLTGTDYVRRMIIDGHSAREIRARWMPEVEQFKVRRQPYLLYPL